MVPDQVVTNLFFGGCNPADPGMQIIERVTATAAAAESDSAHGSCRRGLQRSVGGLYNDPPGGGSTDFVPKPSSWPSALGWAPT